MQGNQIRVTVASIILIVLSHACPCFSTQTHLKSPVKTLINHPQVIKSYIYQKEFKSN